jgi:cytosine/adenosine deaminase-related metal-dependent hydrolase
VQGRALLIDPRLTSRSPGPYPKTPARCGSWHSTGAHHRLPTSRGAPPGCRAELSYGATGAASQAIGRADQFGSIRPGLSADVLLVPGDVARDVRLLAAVGAVYFRGQLVTR